MEPIIRNVKDIDADDRRSLEHVVGQPLRDNQQLVIQVMTVTARVSRETLPEGSPVATAIELPDYCNVYDGLSDAEVAELESLILDRHPARSSS